MAFKAYKIENIPGQYFDVSYFHGHWCTITMKGRDVGFAQVGIISSNETHILFQYKNRRGIACKEHVKDLTTVRMSEWSLKRQQELNIEPWPEGVSAYEMFLDKKVDIHVHQTRLFEASPGFFAARITFAGENTIVIRENGSNYTLKQSMIAGFIETQY